MCKRFTPLTIAEAEEAIANRARSGRATIGRRADAVQAAVPDAYPGATVPVFVPQRDGRLEAVLMAWGFWGRPPAGVGVKKAQATSDECDRPAPKLIFNTRLDTATRQLHDGHGLWAQAMAHGRCLIPVRAFFEQGSADATLSPCAGKTIRKPYRFTLAGSPAFLLAGIAEDGRFSIVTTEPNAQVAPIHNRMPLVLGRGESAVWLAGDLERLADRSGVRLDVEAEDEDETLRATCKQSR